MRTHKIPYIEKHNITVIIPETGVDSMRDAPEMIIAAVYAAFEEIPEPHDERVPVARIAPIPGDIPALATEYLHLLTKDSRSEGYSFRIRTNGWMESGPSPADGELVGFDIYMERLPARIAETLPID